MRDKYMPLGTLRHFIEKNKLIPLNMRCYSVFILLLIFVLLTSTPYYGVGYLGVIFVAAYYLRPIKGLGSYFSNTILSFLIFNISIMIAGFAVIVAPWIPLQVWSVLLFAVIVIPIIQSQERPAKREPFVKKLDIIIILIAALGPLSILGLQMSKYEPQTAIYKVVNGDGWDSSVHISIPQLNGRYNGYVYREAGLVNERKALSTPYPQGWHLATSNFANGFGGIEFGVNRTQSFRTLVVYIASVYMWYVIAMFFFLKFVAYYALKDRKKENLITLSMALLAISLLPALTVLFSSLYQGFVNFIAIIPLIILFIVASIQYVESKKLDLYLAFSIPIMCGLLLTWTLPIPGVLGVFLVVILFKSRRQDFLQIVKKWPLVISGLVVAAVSLWYVIILSKHIGFGHVYENTGFVAGFPRPEMALILAIITIGGVYKKIIKVSFDQLVLIMAPLVSYTFMLWILSYIESDTIGYYQSKMLALLAVVLMMFASIVIACITMKVASRVGNYALRAFAALGVSISLVGAIIIMSNNPLNLKTLKLDDWKKDRLQSSVLDWVYDSKTSNESQLVVIGDGFDVSYNKSMLFNQLDVSYGVGYYTGDKTNDESVNPLGCVSPYGLFYMGTIGSYSIDQVLQRLSGCLQLRSEKRLSTEILSDISNREALESINTHGARIIYVR